MNNQPAAIPSDEITTTREEFDGSTAIVQRETAASAVAARSTAEIQARHIMAIQRPRNLDAVRLRVLAECKRPGFAKTARYRKPIGAGIEGPSIRFAEAAARCMGNLAVNTTVTFDDAKKTILHVCVSDLENNSTYETEIVVQKTVERKRLGRGQAPLGQRSNSYGDTVYLVPATDDEMLNQINALVSKAVRTLILRHLPGDILEEAMDVCIKTAADKDAEDPDAARRGVFDAFAGIGVMPDGLCAYLGHDGKALVPAELAELRAVYAAIRDGETTWQAVMEHRTGEAAATEHSEKASKVDAVLEKAREKAAAKRTSNQGQA
jgi:hypothetical protein